MLSNHSFTLSLLSRHTKNLKLAFLTLLLLSGSAATNAQELTIPQKWKKTWTNIRPIYKSDTLTVCILGDIMMHQQQISSARRSDGSFDFSSYFTFIEDEIRSADVSIANMEFTLAGKPYTGYPCFSAPDSFAEYMAGCGFDIFLAANNHIFDKGTRGAERTLEIYRNLQESNGIRFTGIAGDEEEMAGSLPLFITSKGIRLALVNFTYGTNNGLGTHWPKTNYIGEKVKLGKAFSKAEENDADFIIALPHWGTEYILEHTESQMMEAEWLIENGADWVIGAHPHVVQDTTHIKGTPVVFSMGNAVSNMSARNTQIGLMVTLRIIREGNGDLRPLPLGLTYLWCSRPGGYNGSYTVIPVKEFIGRKGEWINAADYDKMLSTYERVKKETGIND